MKKYLILLITVIFGSTLVGCRIIEKINNNALPGRVVAISIFKCKCDPLLKESIQDGFVDVFFKYTNSKPVKAESGDIVIVGIVTMEDLASGSSESNVSGGGGQHGVAINGSSSSSAVIGNKATGITAQAYKNGELIATYSLGQTHGQKGGPVSPVKLATDAAYRLAQDLVRKNEINWR